MKIPFHPDYLSGSDRAPGSGCAVNNIDLEIKIDSTSELKKGVLFIPKSCEFISLRFSCFLPTYFDYYSSGREMAEVVTKQVRAHTK